jgi:hypothetical protein
LTSNARGSGFETAVSRRLGAIRSTFIMLAARIGFSTHLRQCEIIGSTIEPTYGVQKGHADGSGKPNKKAVVVSLNFCLAPGAETALDEIVADVRSFEMIPVVIVRERKILYCLDDPMVRG